MSYPYLLASLPPLRFSRPPEITSEEFIELCRGLLSERDMEILQGVFEGRHDDLRLEVLAQYNGFRRSLDHEIVQLRQKNLEHPAPLSLEPMPEAPRPQAEEAFGAHNPLEGEMNRLYHLWDRLKQMAGQHFLDLEALVLYALRLRILERKARFDAQAGRERLKQLAHDLLPDRYLAPRVEEGS